MSTYETDSFHLEPLDFLDILVPDDVEEALDNGSSDEVPVIGDHYLFHNQLNAQEYGFSYDINMSTFGHMCASGGPFSEQVPASEVPQMVDDAFPPVAPEVNGFSQHSFDAFQQMNTGALSYIHMDLYSGSSSPDSTLSLPWGGMSQTTTPCSYSPLDSADFDLGLYGAGPTQHMVQGVESPESAIDFNALALGLHDVSFDALQFQILEIEHLLDEQLLVAQPSLAAPSSDLDVDEVSEHESFPSMIVAEGRAEDVASPSSEPQTEATSTTKDVVSVDEEASSAGDNAAARWSAKTPYRSRASTTPRKRRASQKSALEVRKPKTKSSTSRNAVKPKPMVSTSVAVKSTFKKASAPTSQERCTVEGCTVRCHDKKTRLRHEQTHYYTAEKAYHCPGRYYLRDDHMVPCSNLKGYTRSDALLRHLRSCEEDNPCYVEASKAGWDPLSKDKNDRSLERFRGVIPTRPPGIIFVAERA